MNQMVSVIITSYKRPLQMVQRAIESVLNQSWKDIEIIIVDDNTDEDMNMYRLGRIVELYPNKFVNYISYPENHGACYARNIGIDCSNGDYLAFLDDDDEWLPDKIEKQMKVMQSSDVALVYCSAFIKNDTTGTMSCGKKCEKGGRIYSDLILENFIGSTSFPLLKKRCVVDVGKFDVCMQSAQDYDLWLRLSAKYNVGFVDEALGIYHVHEGEQITRNPDKKINGLMRINEKNREYLAYNRRARWYRKIKIVPFYAKKGLLLQSLFMWLKSASICPMEVKNNIRYLLYIFIEYKCYLKNILLNHKKNRGG